MNGCLAADLKDVQSVAATDLLFVCRRSSDTIRYTKLGKKYIDRRVMRVGIACPHT